MSSISLDEKLIYEIEGEFVVPSYQRGYRWNDEVTKLLDDITNISEGQSYCLQPVVVKRLGEKRCELIDGQQRLTTIYLILKYILTFLPKAEIKFNLDYDIRVNSKTFLEDFDFDTVNTGINNFKMDEYFMHNAAVLIRQWFGRQKDETQAAIDINTNFNKKIKIIWYEVDNTEKPEALFARLNIGRIPLTNAELVKALFLSRKGGVTDEKKEKQLEIVTSWDIIEKELHNDSLWYFITNEPAERYASRIELVFDLRAEKESSSRDKFHTFFWFSDQMKSKKPSDVWEDIQHYFQRLKEWYEDRDFFHKIGYLVATGTKIQALVKESSDCKLKSEFRETLNKKIAETINFDNEYANLSYERDYTKIKHLLLLFNVETMRKIDDNSSRFPFERHKGESWSLEHIHARHFKGLNKRELWIKWLESHKKSLISIKAEKDLEAGLKIEALIAETTAAINDNNLSREQFDSLSEKIADELSAKNGKGEDTDNLHILSNMALLGLLENSFLNDAAFDVKRDRIIELDMNGAYIPVCTKMVFLKYYTPSGDNQIHFWAEEDRKAYLGKMNEKLRDYLFILQKEIR